MANKKAQNQRKHAKRRAFERFGLTLHADAQRQIVRSIQDREARLIRRQSRRVLVFEVEYDGRKLPVVYDCKRKTIVTVLPQEALTTEGENHERGHEAI